MRASITTFSARASRRLLCARPTPMNHRGKTLLLVHEDVRNPRISDQALLDDKLIEVSWEGEILWAWPAHEHFDELGFDDAAKTVLSVTPI